MYDFIFWLFKKDVLKSYGKCMEVMSNEKLKNEGKKRRRVEKYNIYVTWSSEFTSACFNRMSVERRQVERGGAKLSHTSANKSVPFDGLMSYVSIPRRNLAE